MDLPFDILINGKKENKNIQEDKNIQDIEKENKKKTIKYSDKKKLAILHAKYYLENNLDFKDFFNNHKKNDDLADSFLQGLYYIKKDGINER
jgi:hypothetical protein